MGREDLYYGYDNDNTPTPAGETSAMIAFLTIAENNGIEALVTDYCWTQSYVDNSYLSNQNRGYISFAASYRELDNNPTYPATPYQVNTADFTSLSAAKNFLYLINPESYTAKNNFLNAIKS